MKKVSGSSLSLFAMALCMSMSSPALADEVQWINHLGFLPESSDVATAYHPGLNGLNLTATAEGDYVIAQGVQVPPGYLVSGVRVCYDLIDVSSYITQIRLQSSNASEPVLDDTNDLISIDPDCADIRLSPSSIDPSAGALTLVLGLHFGATPQDVFVSDIGLLTIPDPDSPLHQLPNHTHDYLTGKGVGHNKVVATTGGPVSQEDAPDTVVPLKNNGHK